MSIETKLVLLKKFDLLTKLLYNFSESKKQISYVKSMICTEFNAISKNQYLMNEKDSNEIYVSINELKVIGVRFYKAKDTEDFNRAKELLNRFEENLQVAIARASIREAEEKSKNLIGSVIGKVKTGSDSLKNKISNLCSAVTSKQAEDTEK